MIAVPVPANVLVPAPDSGAPLVIAYLFVVTNLYLLIVVPVPTKLPAPAPDLGAGQYPLKEMFLIILTFSTVFV